MRACVFIPAGSVSKGTHSSTTDTATVLFVSTTSRSSSEGWAPRCFWSPLSWWA
uniref:Uncharacterized protein n=1 Tax=Aegilops tauschii subsp. strangulata TaxID=200361 RepID=A0A453SEA6_AEGTS